MSTAGVLSQNDLDESSPLLGYVGTSFRLLYGIAVTSALMLAWLLTLGLLLPLVVPGRGSEGINADMPLNQLLGSLTIFYYLPLLPFLLLPMEEEDRFTWFSFAAVGWVASLFAAVGLLETNGQLAITDLPALPTKALAVLVSVAFLPPMVICLVARTDGWRRLTSMAILVVAWIVAEAETFGFIHLFQRVESQIQDPVGGLRQAALLLASLLAVVLATTPILPLNGRFRGQLTALGLLLWSFTLTGLLCFLLGTHRLTTIGNTGEESFVCLMRTAWVAPFISWLGAPWNRDRRAVTLIVLVLAGLLAIVALSMVGRYIPVFENLMHQIWTHYDGPRIFRRV